MAAQFVIVPQWQGSGSSRAMRLVDGAEAILGDLPSSATHLIEVPALAGDERGTGLRRYGSLLAVRASLADALATIPEVAITIGGDCSVELAAVEHARDRSGGDLAVVWFDAHPDLHTLDSSESGAFTGMVLRAIAGEGVEDLVASPAIDATHIVLAGARAIDDAEGEFIAESGIRTVGVTELSDPAELVRQVEATGASSVYLHIDVDVLDPAEFSGKGDPVPFGIEPSQLIAAIRALKERFTLAGAGITEFAPASPEAAVDDLPTLLRVIGALAS
jgi:arginase